ncbi:hypothetical protein [Sphingopyxis macrogoltabida]|uniref:hypothetical protein n=1 Tax=Sphingopyxis macrogoltabida TaxID=33050 RepID=UPI00191C24E6|nr:hypothetical protein [Sphingopyxis macrogoltabida]
MKIIGAAAHFVTAKDVRPVIEQDVRRVSHAAPAEEMVAIGREIEASVLSRAVRWHADRRISLNGNQTVVIRPVKIEAAHNLALLTGFSAAPQSPAEPLSRAPHLRNRPANAPA